MARKSPGRSIPVGKNKIFGFPRYLPVGVILINCWLLPALAQSVNEDLGAQLRAADDELNQAYASLTKSLDDVAKRKLKAEQLAWLKQRDAECWLDAKEVDREAWMQSVLRTSYKAQCITRVTEVRTIELQRRINGVDISDGAFKRGRPLSDFTLVSGLGTEVCEAYTERLNRTEFGQQPPLPRCGRPENTKVDGFQLLNRVQLAPEQLHNMYEHLHGFADHLDQDYFDKERKRLLSFCDKPGYEKVCNSWMEKKQSAESRGYRWMEPRSFKDMQPNGPWPPRTFAWRYDPPVDIDNDGKPDPVLLFKTYRCDGVQESPIYAFLMDESYQRVDEERTRAVFGHPNQKFTEVSDAFRAFRFLGLSFGVFEFNNVFYFDTFERTRGEFQDRYLPSKRGDGLNLGVFNRDSSNTRLICEIRWNDLQGALLDR